MLIKNIKGFPPKKEPTSSKTLVRDTIDIGFNQAREIIGNIPICLDVEKILNIIYNPPIEENNCYAWALLLEEAKVLAQHLSAHMGEIVKKEE